MKLTEFQDAQGRTIETVEEVDWDLLRLTFTDGSILEISGVPLNHGYVALIVNKEQ